jgi:hypothetical protein
MTLAACGGGEGSSAASNFELDLNSKEGSSALLAIVSGVFSLTPTSLTFANAFQSYSKSSSSINCPGAGNTFSIVINPDGIPNVLERLGETPLYDSFEVKNDACVLSDVLDDRSDLKSRISGSTLTLLTDIVGYQVNSIEPYSFVMKTTSKQTENLFSFKTSQPLLVPFSGKLDVSFTSVTSVTHETPDPESPIETLDTEISKTSLSTAGDLGGVVISGQGNVDSHCIRSFDGSAVCKKFDVTWLGNVGIVNSNKALDAAEVTTASINLNVRVTSPITLNRAGAPIEGDLSVTQGGSNATAVFSQDGIVPKVTINSKAGSVTFSFSDLINLAKRYRY